MKQRPRIYYSESQRRLMWERWRKGETIHQIAKLFDRGALEKKHVWSETVKQPVQRSGCGAAGFIVNAADDQHTLQVFHSPPG